MKIKTNINLLSLIVVILIVCVVFSSCGNNNNVNESSSTSFATTSSYIEESTTFSQTESANETTIETTTIETTVGTTTEETTTETTTEETTTETIVTETTTEETTSVVERVDFIDEKTESYGEYLKLTYNPRYCDIDCEIQKGLGKREIYTLTITMKDGYVFDGWTTNNKMSNNKSTRKPPVSIDKTYAFTAQSEINVYANYSMTVGYHGNGGTIDGYDYITELFSVSSLFCLNTKPNEKNIIRDGYTLIGYNTKQDGSGDFISVGSKYYANASEIDLY